MIQGDYTTVAVDMEAVCFKEWLCENMELLNDKKEYNKKKNFRSKRLALLSFPICYFVLLFISLKFEIFDIPVLTFLICLIPTYILCKWIDVKKYQETWSRYSGYRARILLEMVKYIYEIPPYENKYRKNQFIQQVLLLTDANVNKFQDNIENNEEKVFSSKEVVGILKKK